MRQIICMNWGTLYGATYINRLYGMVKSNISGPFRFICLTEVTEGVRSEVECYPCPSIDLPEPQCKLGWRKVNLFAESIDGLEQENTLFLDLDIVITGSLDPFFEYKPELSFVVIHNWTQKNAKIGNTSVYRFRVGSHPYVLNNLLENQKTLLQKFPNSQTYISNTIETIDFWPKEWCKSFKVHCIPSSILSRWFQEPAVPEGARIIAFTGLPNPDDAILGRWPAPWYKKIYKHIRPTHWIKKYWEKAE